MSDHLGRDATLVGQLDLLGPDHHLHWALEGSARNGEPTQHALDHAAVGVPGQHDCVADEAGHIKIDRSSVQGRRCCRLDKPAGPQQCDLMTHRQGFGLIAGDEHRRRPLFDERVQDRLARLGPE